ncbi:hypothetical protein CBS101457_003670 [Exobasidium rhododendri]|nr:hypothetical protein CBS101457_003670 [Exobasidium rhododendri]
MAPPKKGELIKGQASLSSFFSGGGLTPAAIKAHTEAIGQGSPSPKKKSSKSEQNGSSIHNRQEVVEVKDKIVVAGYKASPSASPHKRETHENRTEEMTPSSSSKYFGATSKTTGKKSDPVLLSDSSEADEAPVQKKKAGGSSKVSARPKAKRQLKDSDSDIEVQEPAKKGRQSKEPVSSKASPRKGQKLAKAKAKKEDDYDDEFDDLDDDDFEMLEEAKPATMATNGKANAKPVKTALPKQEAEKPRGKESETDTAMKLDKEGDKVSDAKPKFNWAEAQKRKSAGPLAPGSKEIPYGKPNCLSGLTLVFTGELSSLSRDESTDLAKRFGAKVTSAISSKTSYVVMGADAGKSKIDKQKQLKTKMLDEDGFLNLIAERSAGPVKIDEATQKKLDDDRKKIEKAAAEMKPPANATEGANPLWTMRYAPQNTKDLVGNGPSIAKLREWLHDWQKSLACGFKKPGKNAMNIFRAVLISGPPGIGKTSAAHIIAKLEGYTPIELNASDVRSKKLIDASLSDTINNSSLDSWYNGGDKKNDKSATSAGVKLTDRTVLIMDEVDGMSGGDRGGVGAINALIKKTKVPIICICNDAKNPKMKPMERTAAQLKFSKPDARQVCQRLMTISFREKLNIKPEVMDQLVQAAQSDIRLVINMLSTWALDKRGSMNFDEGKQLGAANVKPGMHTPFSLYGALSAPGMWAATNKKTLNEKTEYYFQDHSFVPLMVQQNYINQVPPSLNRYGEKEKGVRLMQTITRAAESISDGDLVDRMIHSSEQHWSLMPFHGIVSTVKPLSYAHGQSASFPSFSSWLGQNSKQQRLTRAAVELQARMRLVTAASRFEVREQYLPYFFPRLIRPLLDAKKAGNNEAAIAEIIDFMDDYYMTLEDREIVLELGMDENDGEALTKQISPPTKAAFTRKYNAVAHPVAFYKGTDFGAKVKKLVGEPAPDVEEAFEAEEVPDDESGDEKSDGEIDLSKDKFFKQKSSKGKGKAKK